MAVAARVRERFETLTRSQQRLAEYVLANPDGAAFMTAKQLAQATQSSDAAVVRLSQALGYQGFQELRSALREEMLARTGSTGVAASYSGDLTGPELLREAFQLDRSLLEETERLNDWPTYARIIDHLMAARRVFVTAHGSTYPLAAYLAMTLNHALGKVDVLTVGAGDVADRLRSVEPADVVIGIGYIRYLPHTVDILRLSRDAGATTIAITDKASSPLARLSSETLLVARDGLSFTWSQVGTMAIANLLVAGVAQRGDAAMRQRLTRSDELLKSLGHWKE